MAEAFSLAKAVSAIRGVLADRSVSAVLRERLLFIEQQLQLAHLVNNELTNKLAQAQQELARYRGGAKSCPFCGAPEWRLEDVKPDAFFGDSGAKREYYRCGTCGKTRDMLVNR